jgi:hypothetical protein
MCDDTIPKAAPYCISTNIHWQCTNNRTIYCDLDFLLLVKDVPLQDQVPPCHATWLQATHVTEKTGRAFRHRVVVAGTLGKDRGCTHSSTQRASVKFSWSNISLSFPMLCGAT